jgi:cytochrome c oxidase assembly factor CtaG
MPAALAVYHGAIYHGPPALTPGRAFTQWALDPWALAVLAVAAGLYVAGVRRARAGEGWRPGPAAAAVTALVFGVIATQSPLAVYARVLVSARGVQTVLVLLVVPLFTAMARPLSLVIAAWPRAGRRLTAAVRSRAAVIATFPAITTTVLVITPFLVWFSPWYAAGLRSGLIRELTLAALFVPGFVFFWTLLRADPVPKAYSYLVSMWITGAEVVGDAVLGLAVIADNSLIAGGYYHALARPWGPSLRTDQVLGGGALWILGDIVGLPFLAAQLIALIREDEQEAAVVDAELDERDAAAAPASAGEPPADHEPWWESDPRFAERFRAVRPPGHQADR